MTNSFGGKVILVTGEVSDLSAGIIQSFLHSEAIVIFPAKSLHQIESLKAFGDIYNQENFVTLLIDVLDFDKVMETCEAITDKFGKIDIAIEIPEFSNAKKELTEASLDEWNTMMESDMLPFFMGARVVLNLMKGNLSGMFVHVTDARLLENLKSCALARVAFTTRLEMSKIFAEEAHRHGIRYYHLWADGAYKQTVASDHLSPETSIEKISGDIKKLYQKETYSTEEALQSFPDKMVHHTV